MIPYWVLVWLAAGALGGLLAGVCLKRWEYGAPGDIGLGMLGGFIGGLLFSHMHIRIGSQTTTAVIAGSLAGVAFVVMTRAAYDNKAAKPER